MNFDNQFYSSFNYTAQSLNLSQLAPLTIIPVASAQTESIWSPFSTPSFSPYGAKETCFQYSSFSPNPQVTHSYQERFSRPFSSKNSPARSIWSENINIQLNSSGSQFKPKFLDANKPEARLPKRSDHVDMSDTIKQAALHRALGGRAKLCTFCKSNGECEEIYTSHSLKDSSDKITCPILQKYSCPVCGASGEQTHTKKYCPMLQKRNRLDMLKKLSQN